MRSVFMLVLLLVLINPVFPQNAKDYTNTAFLKKLNKDTFYLELKKKIVSELRKRGYSFVQLNNFELTSNKASTHTYDKGSVPIVLNFNH